MRYILDVKLPLEKFNAAVSDGSAGAKMQKIIEDAKPEAVYFAARNGKRSGILIINMENASEIPKYAEPWFLQFDAELQFYPCMTPEDLAKAGLEGLGKKWG